MESHIADISRVIQLAVAPVFLLTAIATLVATLNNRLGRIVDRRRAVLERAAAAPGEVSEDELALLSRRASLVYLSIFAAVLAALFICLVVVGAFLAALVATDLSRSVAALFILSMLALVVALSLFLREVYLAVSHATHFNR